MAWPILNTAGIIETLKRKISSIQQKWRITRRENERLRREVEQLRREQEQLHEERQRLRQEQERLRRENERLKRQLAAAQRANKRQAAPFSRGSLQSDPQRLRSQSSTRVRTGR